jgi:hypothetical protein
MQFNTDQLVLLGILTASLHWLIARASITKPFWDFRWWPTRFPVVTVIGLALSMLLACASCSGFWIGLGFGIAGVRPIGEGVLGVLASGCAGILLTPVFEGVLLWGLERTHIDPMR